MGRGSNKYYKLTLNSNRRKRGEKDIDQDTLFLKAVPMNTGTNFCAIVALRIASYSETKTHNKYMKDQFYQFTALQGRSMSHCTKVLYCRPSMDWIHLKRKNLSSTENMTVHWQIKTRKKKKKKNITHEISSLSIYIWFLCWLMCEVWCQINRRGSQSIDFYPLNTQQQMPRTISVISHNWGWQWAKLAHKLFELGSGSGSLKTFTSQAEQAQALLDRPLWVRSPRKNKYQMSSGKEIK